MLDKLKKNNEGVGNKLDVSGGKITGNIDVGGSIKVKGNKIIPINSIMTAYHSTYGTQSINVSATYTEYPIELNASNLIGSKLSLSNNKIIIGSGVKKILVSGMVAVNRGTTSNMIYTNIYKNSEPIGYSAEKFVDWMQSNIVTDEVLVDVNEGDKISMVFATGEKTGTYQIRRGINLTRLTVKAIGEV